MLAADGDEQSDRPEVGQRELELRVWTVRAVPPLEALMQPVHCRTARQAFFRNASAPKQRLQPGELFPEFLVVQHREPPIRNEASAIARIPGVDVHACRSGNAPEGYRTAGRNVLLNPENGPTSRDGNGWMNKL